jgi:hypothetical protein
MLSLKTGVDEPTIRKQQKKIQKKLIFVGTLKATVKKGRIWIRNPMDGSKDPDPNKNVTDPEH